MSSRKEWFKVITHKMHKGEGHTTWTSLARNPVLVVSSLLRQLNILQWLQEHGRIFRITCFIWKQVPKKVTKIIQHPRCFAPQLKRSLQLDAQFLVLGTCQGVFWVKNRGNTQGCIAFCLNTSRWISPDLHFKKLASSCLQESKWLKWLPERWENYTHTHTHTSFIFMFNKTIHEWQPAIQDWR